MTQEFHISVTPVGDNQYLVRTEKVASGVPLAEEQVKWPVDEWLAQARQLMNDPLLGVLEGQSVRRSRGLSQTIDPQSTSDPPLLSLVELGQQLYHGLFQGTLHDSWTCAQAIAQNRQELLQLRLGLKGKRLSSLPWEVLHAADRPIATGTDVVFSRYQPGMSSTLQTQVRKPNQPLKILIAIAAPTDQDTLQLKREVLHLQEELRRENRRSNGNFVEPPTPDIQLTILEQPDREQLTQALEQGEYQVFHYAGHSNLGVSGGELYLVSRRTGLTETLNGDDLAGLLVNNGVQMVVLNSCRGAYGNTPDVSDDPAQLNLAEYAIKRGIPGVLAMAERIPDDVALTLTRLLYRNLNQGYPIDLSLSRARQGLISAYGSDQLYWALPILYLHRGFNGYLTTTQANNSILEEQEFLPLLSASAEQEPQPKSTSKTLSLSELDNMNDDHIEDLLDDMVCEDNLDNDSDDLDFIGDFLNQSRVENPPTKTELISNSGAEKPLFSPLNSPSKLIKNKSSNSDYKNFLSGLTAVNLFKGKRLFWFLPFLLIPLGFGALWWQNMALQSKKLSQTGHSTSLGTVNSNKPQATDLKTANTDYVLGIAVDQFYQRNLLAAEEATTELLDRGALQKAKSALAAVQFQDLNNPIINFLHGRLAWQSIQRGSTEYKIDDVRRHWAKAVQQSPDNIEYKNALGFAYYTEGKLENAYQVWMQVLEINEPVLSGNIRPGTANNIQSEVKQHDKLNAYAGIALVWWKFAQTLPSAEKEFMLSKAVKFSNKVLSEAPTQFQPNELSQNWMWSKELIRDWQLLQEEK
ncbi:CHAT domain-containing protein [Planktothrix paucivesiculata]|uniref:Heterocyst differentiation protein n=1 Tax=Planktothrix paucivesiculata PCC 9631 TaxID=671071 RepID=A0A7Z9DW72_9CYAN|nr:CHAT domain-containing protein [Planktothrix paucivesiculata]VXD14179.1 Heterocyst differentiation protein [Planktothrix paucivesiculata PCC 9631]